MIRRSVRLATAWAVARMLDGLAYNWNGDHENPAGAQCVNVPNAYRRALGLAPIGGDAQAWVGYTDGETEWVPVDQAARHVVGDVLVWGVTPETPEGHVALVLDGSKYPIVEVLEENYPTGSAVHRSRRYVVGHAGALRS